MELFDEIYRKYQPDVTRFLYRLTGFDTQLTEELTQEIFYQAYLSFPRFRGECTMKTWLCQIARNVYGKHIRREIRQRGITNQLAAETSETGSDIREDFENAEQIRHIRQIISEMKEPARTVTEYRLYSEMSYAEIAELLHIREGTAAVIFNRAKAKIRQRLKEEYGYEI